MIGKKFVHKYNPNQDLYGRVKSIENEIVVCEKRYYDDPAYYVTDRIGRYFVVHESTLKFLTCPVKNSPEIK